MEQNLRQLVLGQWMFLFVLFVLIKLIILLLKKLQTSHIGNSQVTPQPKNTIKPKKVCIAPKIENSSRNNCQNALKIIIKYFEQCISFKSILMCLIGSNLIFFSFQLGAQFQTYFAFSSTDRLNLCITALSGFIFTIVFITIFTVNHSISNKIQTNRYRFRLFRPLKTQLSMKQWYQDMNIVVFTGFKSILYGFVHGYFLQQPKWQYLMLMMIKVALILIICKNHQLFKYLLTARLTILYFVIGTAIDLLCLMNKFNYFPSVMNAIAFVSYGQEVSYLFLLQSLAMIVLLLSIILIVISETYCQIKQLLSSTGNNKVRSIQKVAQRKPHTLFSIIKKTQIGDDYCENIKTPCQQFKPFQKLRKRTNLKACQVFKMKQRSKDHNEQKPMVQINRAATCRIKKLTLARKPGNELTTLAFSSINDQLRSKQSKLSTISPNSNKQILFSNKTYRKVKTLKQPSLLTVNHFLN